MGKVGRLLLATIVCLFLNIVALIFGHAFVILSGRMFVRSQRVLFHYAYE